MIYTVTFNPSIDYIVSLEDFGLGTVNRVTKDAKYPGGKGINVSRVLNNLGKKSKALGFIGGFTGDFIEEFLKKENIDTHFIKIYEDTRINVKVKSNEETEINGNGPHIDDESLERLFNKIKKIKEDDYLVLSGNIQNSLPRNMYSKIQSLLKDKRVKVIVDTTKEALISTLENKPFLIKPNIKELEEIFETNIETREDVISYGKKLVAMGAQNVIISMGKDGALLVNKDVILYGEAPKGESKNSVGAGDSLVAGFIYGYGKNKNLLDGFKWGIACGSATAFSMDLCERPLVEKLLKEIKILTL
ncbi:1-phosphofructokinase [Anaeromicrobium sediminis]|uniref:Tagatose-6-phosphate kinase n=1 Tax=Anaeromicrobium sediminis TaxID=1478221 RepID=A0A267MP80_9FIRM|nr:1-phosphofructokinase [Anaeromicrobium sediminis]PAB60708.1 1-phosphofructokinase [Anaeromicrobium sediminis]